MADRRITRFVPRWARGAGTSFGDLPVTGAQPALAPMLPIRLLPHSHGYSVTALTLGQIATTTQRMMTYASYEAVHGISPEFADLRSVGGDVAQLAELEIEPFEEGSFVLPARLSENPINIAGQEFSGVDVLTRFVDAMESIQRGDAHAVSIGMIQAVEDLGKITRREAQIEYSAVGARGKGVARLLVNDEYVSRATTAKVKRRSTHTKPDELTGKITAVDLVKFTFSLKVGDTSVPGNYIGFLADQMADCLGEHMRVYGVVDYDHTKTPLHIHAIEMYAIQ